MYAVVNQPILDLLAEKRIFTAFGAPRWTLGERVWFEPRCALEPYSQVLTGNVLPMAMGAFSYSHAEFEQHVVVGRYGSIGMGVTWMGASHPTDWVSSSPTFYDGSLPATRHFQETYGVAPPARSFDSGLPFIKIGHDVWIGDGAMIAPGVEIGHGAIVGARSLVLKDVPPYAIVVGQPARLLRYRLAEDLIPRLLESSWWRYAPNVLQPLPMDDPERFLEALEMVRATRPQVLKPVPLTGAELIAAANR